MANSVSTPFCFMGPAPTLCLRNGIGTAALADQAPARLEDALCRVNENVVSAVQSGQLGPPTVHVLQPGTCREYRASKIKAAVTGTGQIKVPAVLRDRETQAWMLRRVKRVIAPAPVSR